MLLVGAGFGGGALLTESVIAAGAAATEVSLLGAAAMANVPTVAKTAVGVSLVVADKVDDALMYFYAAQGDEQAVADYQALQQLGTSDPSPVCDVLAAGIMLWGRRGGVSKYHFSLTEALEQFAEEAPAIQSARGMKSFGSTWAFWVKAANADESIANDLFVYSDGNRIMGAMKISREKAGALEITHLEGLGNGSGTKLLQTAIKESIAAGYNGRVILDSSDQAIQFYERMGGKRIKDNTFFFDERASKNLLRK
jgi:hypothetical protein